MVFQKTLFEIVRAELWQSGYFSCDPTNGIKAAGPENMELLVNSVKKWTFERGINGQVGLCLYRRAFYVYVRFHFTNLVDRIDRVDDGAMCRHKATAMAVQMTLN